MDSMHKTRLALLSALLLAVMLLSACVPGAEPTAVPEAKATNAAEVLGPEPPPTTEAPTSAPTSPPAAPAPTVAPQGPQPLTRGSAPPEFTLEDLSGTPRSLEEFRGQVVMLNFWASWCGFCRSEIPHMNAVYKDYAGQGFEIVAVNLGEDPEHLRQFAAENGMEFPILPDVEGITVPLYRIQSIPMSYFLDAEGVVQATYAGAIQEETLRTIVKTLLGQ